MSLNAKWNFEIGKISEPVFAETRLRRGVYGQRYDNGKRHDGIESKTLEYPRPELMKGPNTVWDAPGMIRIKIPYGELSVEQVEALADLSEEYSDGITHITTRQDVQFHYLHIDDAPDLMRRLAAVGITTREACGNVVRNVTACPFAGVCQGEAFDVSPYAHALTFFLMGHPDTQDFGRKVKNCFFRLCNQSMWSHDFSRHRSDRSNPRSRRGSHARLFLLRWRGPRLGSLTGQTPRRVRTRTRVITTLTSRLSCLCPTRRKK